MPGASKAIGAIVAGPSLVAALCLAGALAAFLVYPAYAQSGDEASAPSNLTAAIADGGVILNWSSPVQDAASVTGYEILRRRPTEGEDTLLVLVADTSSTATTYVDATANEQGTRWPGHAFSRGPPRAFRHVLPLPAARRGGFPPWSLPPQRGTLRGRPPFTVSPPPLPSWQRARMSVQK